MKTKLLFCFITMSLLNLHAQWKPTNGPYGADVNCLASEGSNVYVGTERGVFRSIDAGNNWEFVSEGTLIERVYSIAAQGSVVYVGTFDQGVFRSVDKGETWTRVNNGLVYNDERFSSIAIADSFVYVCSRGTVYISSDSGAVWTNVTNNLQNTYVMNLCASGNDIYASGYGGAYRSSDRGQNWEFIWDQSVMSPGASLSALEADGDIIVIGTLGGGLQYSKDHGITWKLVKSVFFQYSISTIKIKGNSIFVSGDYDSGDVLVSHDFGMTWSRYNLGLIDTETNALSISGSTIYAGTDGGVYSSVNEGRSWREINNGLLSESVSAMISTGSSIMVSTYTNSIFQTGNDGISWDRVNNGIETKEIYSLLSDGSNVYCGNAEGIFLSKDLGKTWISKNDGSSPLWVPTTFFNQGTKIFAGTNRRVIMVSEDRGETWSQHNKEVGFPANEWSWIYSLSIEGSNIIVGTSYHGIYTSFDNGNTWRNTLTRVSTGTAVKSIIRTNSKIFAATTDGIYVSENSGASWTYLGSQYFEEAYSLLHYNNVFYAGTSNGVFLSKNDGKDWHPISQGLFKNSLVYNLLVKDQLLYAGLYDGSVWRRSLSEITRTNNQESAHPFSAFPNPTMGIFSITNLEDIESIEIYNWEGSRIYYDPNFKSKQSKIIDLSDQAPGVYFIRVKGNAKFFSEKLIILK